MHDIMCDRFTMVLGVCNDKPTSEMRRIDFGLRSMPYRTFAHPFLLSTIHEIVSAGLFTAIPGRFMTCV